MNKTALILFGFAVLSVVVGVALIYPPAGLIVAGLLAGALALLQDDGRPGR